jgi:homoprotocatechuate degradation regulator HpaR
MVDDSAPAPPPVPVSLRRTERSLPIALLRAREAVMGPVREMLAQSPVNEQKWRVLRVLDEEGPLPLTLVADHACLQAPSLTRIMRVMEEDGLVSRVTGTADRRTFIVGITDRGRQIIADHAAASNALFARLEALYGKDKLETLLDLLDDLQSVKL